MPEEGEKLTTKKYKPFNAAPSHRKSFLRYKSQQCLTLDSAIGPTLLNIVGRHGTARLAETIDTALKAQRDFIKSTTLDKIDPRSSPYPVS